MLKEKIATISAMGITCIKNAANPYYNSKYADLSTVVEALKKPLEEQGLGYRFCVYRTMDGTWVCSLRVYDLQAGEGTDEAEGYEFPIAETNPQKFGACVTYARRYLLTTAFNVIAEEDDDGNTASGVDVKPTLPKKVPTKLNINEAVGDEVPQWFK